MILFLESAKHKLEILAIDGKILLGRADDNTYVLDDPSVSRHHLEIFFRGNKGWTIRDLDSTAGTFVNGKRVKEPVEVYIGDKLKIGGLTFNVHFKGGEDVPQVSSEVKTKVLPEEQAANYVDIALNKSREQKTAMIPARPGEEADEEEDSDDDAPKKDNKTRRIPESSGPPVLTLALIAIGLGIAGFLAFRLMTAPSTLEPPPVKQDAPVEPAK